MAKAVTRHFKYAWIEFGNPKDAEAFTDGLYGMGWGNLMSSLPLKRDAWGQRYVDSAHPLLPIRWRGSALLILPNERKDQKKFPFLDDPIFEAFRKDKGDAEFKKEIEKQNRFLSRWLFSPGIKKVSETETRLTMDSDFTDYADFTAISGHGAGGNCWGGGLMAHVTASLQIPPSPSSTRLKYVLIATCYNVSDSNADAWLPAFRSTNPIHGLLGYRSGYPGDEPGRVFFDNFVQRLKDRANPKSPKGSKRILDAWREAHPGKANKKLWSAMLHVGNKGDNMVDWMAGKLTTPAKDGEVRWFDEATFPDGKVVVVTPPLFTAHFFMGSTKIDRTNKDDPSVGLFPADSGSLELAARTGFIVGDKITITFFYYRPDKDGMNLEQLLTFGTSPDGTLTLRTDLNKQDNTSNVDGFEFTFLKAVNSTKIPYTVRSDATKNYKSDGEVHGYFNLQISPFGHDPLPSDFMPYPDGAFLRAARP